MNVFDIHMHIIPDVDDGSSSFEESITMLRKAKAQGITSVMATPHNSAFDYGAKYVSLQFNKLRKKAKELGVHLYLGTEILCIDPYEVIDKLNDGTYKTLNGTRYALIEFNPYLTSFGDAYNAVIALKEHDYIPVIAHAERYRFSSVSNIAALKEARAFIQTNLYSFYKEHNRDTREVAQILLDKGIIDFVGTDAHRLNHRPPDAASGVCYVYNNSTKEYADKILFENANRLLGGKIDERFMA